MAGGFHPKDIERIKSKDIWLQRFLEQEDLDPDASLKMLWGSCKWRKEFGANGMDELIFLLLLFFFSSSINIFEVKQIVYFGVIDKVTVVVFFSCCRLLSSMIVVWKFKKRQQFCLIVIFFELNKIIPFRILFNFFIQRVLKMNVRQRKQYCGV